MKKVFLNEFSAVEVKAMLEEADQWTAITCFGSCESHGWHCCLGPDYFVPTEVAKRVAEKLDKVVVVPSVPFGTSIHYNQYPMSVTLRYDTEIAIAEDIFESLINNGIKHISRIHGDSKEVAKKKALEVMRQVGLPDVERLYNEYPHRLSGGMRQRVMIAMALVNQPELLIADEPTTALDVTIQAQIMELIRDMNRKMGTAVLLISHDLGVIRQMCSRVYIMYAGRVVESGETQEVLAHPLHPYTKGLIASIPSLEKRGQRLSSIPGTVPALEDRSEHGCPFYNRCQSRRPSCQNETPPMVVHKGHMALCVNAKEELGL